MRSATLSDRLVAHALESIHGAPESVTPFHHLRLANVFPSDVYDTMVEAMPGAQAYRPMSGRAREARREDGSPTRTKLHLLPEYTRALPRGQRSLWEAVGSALRSQPVREAFVRRLRPHLEKRFGERYRDVGLYPIPMLTRDVAGYRIGVHPDTRHKAITVQLYLPRDASISHVGTIFNRRLAQRTYEVACRIAFLPNTGYAFAVAGDTYHSLDTLGPEVITRDSILLTYFVDDTAWQRVGNRAKRAGNAVLATLASRR